MEAVALTPPGGSVPFPEEEWLRLLFLLGDTEQWLDELSYRLFQSLPLRDKKKLFRQGYYLTAGRLAHILERHYHRIPRHPGTGKFTIPVPDILHWLREAGQRPAEPIPGCGNYKRIVEAGIPVGFDRHGQPACTITILTDSGGRIVTAFPGVM